VIVSTYGKSYDSADGSEQQCADPSGRPDRPNKQVQSAGEAARERWEDDGGPPSGLPPVFARDLASVGEFTSKPAWSVPSLRALNEAVRMERWAENPERLRREADRSDARRAAAAQVGADRAADAARAYDYRHRNAWERPRGAARRDSRNVLAGPSHPRGLGLPCRGPHPTDGADE
jgi:hypothetical protein